MRKSTAIFAWAAGLIDGGAKPRLIAFRCRAERRRPRLSALPDGSDLPHSTRTRNRTTRRLRLSACGVSSSTATVQYLWRTLESFTPEERCLFLRFVWGASCCECCCCDAQ